MVADYEKRDERINVEEVAVVRQDVWIVAPPCLAEEPRLVVEHDLRFISSWRGHTLKELFQQSFGKRRVGQECQEV
jgi:hypothetical protein